MNYTVLLRLPDTSGNWPDDMFLAHVEADTLIGALAAAQRQASMESANKLHEPRYGHSWGWYEEAIAPEDFDMVAIFEGHAKGLAFAATGIQE